MDRSNLQFCSNYLLRNVHDIITTIVERTLLFHETSLAISASVHHRVHLVQERRIRLGLGLGLPALVVTGAGAGAPVVLVGAQLRILVVAGIALAGLALHVRQGSTNVFRLALESVVALATTTKDTALLLELSEGHCGKLRSPVVGGGVVVDLVNGDSFVHDIGLDSLLVDDGLNGLVDVVMYMLSSDCRRSALAVGSVCDNTLILEGSLLSFEVLLGGIGITVVELAMLYGAKLGGVLFWKNFTVLNRLDSAVVVILVNLLVHRSVDLLV